MLVIEKTVDGLAQGKTHEINQKLQYYGYYSGWLGLFLVLLTKKVGLELLIGGFLALLLKYVPILFYFMYYFFIFFCMFNDLSYLKFSFI